MEECVETKNKFEFDVEETVVRFCRCLVIAETEKEAREKAESGDTCFEFLDPDGPGVAIVQRTIVKR